MAEGTREGSRAAARSFVRHLDLIVLVAALPVFVAFDLRLTGYAIFAAVWVTQHFTEIAIERAALRRLAGADRRNAMGLVVGGLLGRVAVVTISILLIGSLTEREVGLACAILAAILVTVSMMGRALSRPAELAGSPEGNG